MRSRALVVPRPKGEDARRALLAAGVLRTDLAIEDLGDEIALPLTEGPVPPGWGAEGEREFREIRSPGPTSYADLLDWPIAEKRRLPRSFDVVGDIVLVRVPEELEPRRDQIGEALLAFVPGARIVGADRGVHGAERRRRIDRLAGSGGWATRHRENGIELEVDLERAYFSPRLAREHALVAEEVSPGDRVYDLCCGVGPFAVRMARDGRARSITAVDANPEAIELLRATLGRLGLESRVDAVRAPIEAFLPSAPPVERVILNLPLEGIKYAPSVATAVAPRGRLYYYEVVARDEVERRVHQMETGLEPGIAWTVVERRAVHPYSPVSDLCAFVLERGA